MKVVRNSIIPFKGYKAITIWPFIFVRKECSFDEVDLNHENIHGRQQLELLILFFYLVYLIELVFKGYKRISFEKEAYANESNLNYLKERKCFAWLKEM